jgi:putative ABC transport system permease protein
MYFILQPKALEYFAINFKGENVDKTIEDVRATWNAHFHDKAFSYFFLDEHFNSQYEHEQKFASLLSFFTILAVVIACLGLFGLTAYAIVRRTKEIGIRKVLGASVPNVIALFTNDFARLILIANVIALPITYAAAIEWLEQYAFRIDLNGWMFVLPSITILIIAMVTLSMQTIKVAVKNPVDSLKYE